MASPITLESLQKMKLSELKSLVKDLNLTSIARTGARSGNLTRPKCIDAICDHLSIRSKTVPQATITPAGEIVARVPEYETYTPIKVTDWSIKRIWHISDIHLVSDHVEWKWDRYRQVLDNTVSAITCEPGDIVVISGDIFHKPSSPNCNIVSIFDTFIRALDEKFQDSRRIIIISGNHDINEAWHSLESSRIEILESLSHVYREMFTYVRYNQVLQYGQTILSVSSLFSPATIRLQDIKIEGPKPTYIALTHCNLLGSQEKLSSSSRHRSIREFHGYDYLLLGDIHLHQSVCSQSPVAYYPGSLMQTNLGEPIGNHGILLWTIQGTSTPAFIEIKDPYANIRMKVENGILQSFFLPPHVRNLIIQFEHTSTTPEQLRKIRDLLSEKYHIIHYYEGRQDNTISIDYRPPAEFIHPNPDIMTLHRELSVNSTDLPSVKNISIRRIFLRNIFNHVHTDIDFTRLNGILSIQGANATGKTNIINAINIALYPNSTDLNISKIILNGKQEASITCDILVGNTPITIARSFRLQKDRRTGALRAEQTNSVLRADNETLLSKSNTKEYLEDILNEVWLHVNQVSECNLMKMSKRDRNDFLCNIFGFNHLEQTIENAEAHLKETAKKRKVASDLHARFGSLRMEEITLPEDVSSELTAIQEKISQLNHSIGSLKGISLTETERKSLITHPNPPANLDETIKETERKLAHDKSLTRELESLYLELKQYPVTLEELDATELACEELASSDKLALLRSKSQQSTIEFLEKQLARLPVNPDTPSDLLPKDDCIPLAVPPAEQKKPIPQTLLTKQETYTSKLSILSSFTHERLQKAYESEDISDSRAIIKAILDIGAENLSSILLDYNKTTQLLAELTSHNERCSINDLARTRILAHNRHIADCLSYYQYSELKALYDEENALQQRIKVLDTTIRVHKHKAILARILETESLIKEETSHRHTLSNLALFASSRQASLKLAQVTERANLERSLRETLIQQQDLQQRSDLYNKMRGIAEITDANRAKYLESRQQLTLAETAHNLALTYHTELKATHLTNILTKCNEICEYTNNILQLCHIPFTCSLTAVNKNIDLSFHPIDSSSSFHSSSYTYHSLSGYQRFITNLALTAAINRSTIHNRLDLLTIDEGFGVIDSTNSKHLATLFSILREQFRNIIIISHVNNIDSYAQHAIRTISTPEGTQVIVDY